MSSITTDLTEYYSLTKLFHAMQTLVISGIKNLFPSNFDYTSFKVIGNRVATNITEHGWIIYDLLEVFIKSMQDNIISSYDYERLQKQTQKYEAQIRAHIGLEQQIKGIICSKMKSTEKYEQMKQYAKSLQNRIKQLQNPTKNKQKQLQKDTKITKSNLNLFKALLLVDLQNKQIIQRRYDKNLDKSRSFSSFETYLSPKIGYFVKQK